MPTSPFLIEMLRRRLPDAGSAWMSQHVAEIGQGVTHSRFANIISLASRMTPRAGLNPDAGEIDSAENLLPGWNPERWSLLETMRVILVLSRKDLGEPSFASALEECFRMADLGEACALYRSLAHLPLGERFLWRAGEGCRTNVEPAFEAVACDTPYPGLYFQDAPFQQLVIKALFIEAPLWRVHGLDGRLSGELARIVLDYADERRAAGRTVPPQLWMCLGEHGGERALASLELEWQIDNPLAQQAVAFGLVRASQHDRLRQLIDKESDSKVAEMARAALEGEVNQKSFRVLET